MKFLQVIYIFLAIGLFLSCNDDKITTTGGNVIRIVNPTVLQTDEFGIVLGGDTTDWCFNNSTLFRFMPAFPNPTDDTTSIVKKIPESDTLSIKYLKSNGDTVNLFSNRAFLPGFYHLQVSASNLNLHGSVTRFIINSKRYPAGADFCRYFGDVQFY